MRAGRPRSWNPRGTISWNGATRPSATWFRATLAAAPPRRCATKATGWGQAVAACISTSSKRSGVGVIEPFRAKAFPVLRDLVVDRSALDRIVVAGGYVSASTGSAPDGDAIPVAKGKADAAMDAAACIGCGACVAACPNASPMLFVGAKVSHLGLLPQGQPERWSRVEAMVAAMDKEGFGYCTAVTECSAICPKEVSMDVIGRANRDRIGAIFMVARRTWEAGCC
jgi:succinate dehydrogenase/fumarate reductase-like Fe-S protein